MPPPANSPDIIAVPGTEYTISTVNNYRVAYQGETFEGDALLLPGDGMSCEEVAIRADGRRMN